MADWEVTRCCATTDSSPRTAQRLLVEIHGPNGGSRMQDA
jgi:hypothetical protein